MDAKQFLEQCLEGSSAIMQQVTGEMFTNETPDTEWTVKDLCGHMLYELVWIPDMVAGRTIAEVGDKWEGALIGDDPAQLSSKWSAAANRAKQAVAATDLNTTAHMSYGDVKVSDYVYEAATDLLVHAWDLAKGIGVPMQFDPAIAQIIYDRTLPRQPELEKSGLFAAPVSVPDDADIQTQLLGLFGRDAHWQPSH